MSYFNRPERRKRQEPFEPEVRVIERIETSQLPLVIWTRRCCPFCGSEEISVTGTREDGELRYYKCGSCKQSFRVREM